MIHILLVDNGDYLVSRNINKSQFIKLNIGAVKDYSLETSIRIGPSKNLVIRYSIIC